MEYTKGEWTKFRFSKFHNWKVSTGDANWYVDCGMEEDSEANARLIAAAPDMYEALKGITAQFAGLLNQTDRDFIDKGVKALAKAEAL